MLKIRICRSPDNLAGIRSLWQRLAAARPTTIFQDFDLNLAAADIFAGREEPLVVCAEASYGAAIIPAVLRRRDGLLRLLGEELFDYRTFLHQGESDVLLAALAALVDQKASDLEIVALRQADCATVPDSLCLLPFSAAPGVQRARLSAEQFHHQHPRLARNLRRLQRLGFEVRSYDGNNPRLVRVIYEGKAVQDTGSLFRDPLRVEFMVKAGLLKPERFEIVTLECAGRVAAALVTILDPGVRRFYTGWFDPELNKHSPGLTLICEITRQSLAAGLDCDYMTGEQPYKLRLADTSVPLYKLKATARQLAALVASAPELRSAG